MPSDKVSQFIVARSKRLKECRLIFNDSIKDDLDLGMKLILHSHTRARSNPEGWGEMNESGGGRVHIFLGSVEGVLAKMALKG